VTERDRSSKLPRSLLVLYALPFAGYLAMGMPVSLWFMKFATDTLLIAPVAIGGVFAVGRVWDAISDPMAGYLSDRTRSRFGRRRIWLFASAVPLAITYVMLWSPPSALEGLWLIAWIAAALLLWETASTAFVIPYAALGLELTDDYHERTRVFGWRQMLTTVGFAASLVILYLLRTAEDERSMAFTASVATGVVVALVIVVCARKTPEPSHHQGRGSANLFSAFADVTRNRYARMLFFVMAVESFGMGVIAVLGSYIIEDLVGRLDLLEAMLAVWMIPQFVFIPVWLRVSKRLGKKNLWLFGMLCSLAGFSGLFSLGQDEWVRVFVCVILIGIGTSVSSVMGPSVQADVVDFDELETGERKEGAYVAVWNFLRKAGSAVAAGVGGLALSVGGYDPAAVEQAEPVKESLRLTVGLIPALSYVAGALVFSRFKLDESEHARIVAGIRERRAERGE
jgi:GPH family glycoside/pentoside/hexuronide:cation symporter